MVYCPFNLQITCGTRCLKALGPLQQNHWIYQEVLDQRRKNHDSGMQVYKVSVEFMSKNSQNLG